MDWNTAVSKAGKFIPMLKMDWPEIIEEMQGKFLKEGFKPLTFMESL
jgi:hypothetical protein